MFPSCLFLSQCLESDTNLPSNCFFLGRKYNWISNFFAVLVSFNFSVKCRTFSCFSVRIIWSNCIYLNIRTICWHKIFVNETSFFSDRRVLINDSKLGIPGRSRDAQNDRPKVVFKFLKGKTYQNILSTCQHQAVLTFGTIPQNPWSKSGLSERVFPERSFESVPGSIQNFYLELFWKAFDDHHLLLSDNKCWFDDFRH